MGGVASCIARLSMSPVTSSSCSLCLTSVGMLKVGAFASPCRGEVGGFSVRMGLALAGILLVCCWSGCAGSLIGVEFGLPSSGGSRSQCGMEASCWRRIGSSRKASSIMSKSAGIVRDLGGSVAWSGSLMSSSVMNPVRLDRR